MNSFVEKRNPFTETKWAIFQMLELTLLICRYCDCCIVFYDLHYPLITIQPLLWWKNVFIWFIRNSGGNGSSFANLCWYLAVVPKWSWSIRVMYKDQANDAPYYLCFVLTTRGKFVVTWESRWEWGAGYNIHFMILAHVFMNRMTIILFFNIF